MYMPAAELIERYNSGERNFPGLVPIDSYSELAGANLSNIILSGADLSRVSLKGTNLRGAQLVGWPVVLHSQEYLL